jgi:hypothetical protein
MRRDCLRKREAGERRYRVAKRTSPSIIMNVHEAIVSAEAILPGKEAAEGEEDPRWQAMIAVGDFVETDPEPVWSFVERWGVHPDEDLRMAISMCILEHLLEYHFDLIFPRMERLARSNPCFAETVGWCSSFGDSELPENAARLNGLMKEHLVPPPSHRHRRNAGQ